MKDQNVIVQNDNDRMIRFFRNEETDSEGRRLEDILLFGDEAVESCHNFIQWILPTQTKSLYNRNAPIIDLDFERLFQADDRAKCGYCMSCRKYLQYIGFDCKSGCIEPKEHIPPFYTRPFHNQLRITRMLYSLSQVGNKECSRRLYVALMKVVREDPMCCINKYTIKYWEETQE